METCYLPDAEFKTLLMRMMNDFSENFNKEIENIKVEIEIIRRINQK